MSKKVVVSLGGNALEDVREKESFYQTLIKLEFCVCKIVDLIENNYEVIISHGNGPQIGRILMDNEMCTETPLIPFDVCVGMSQGMIGYYIEQAIRNELYKRRIKRGVVVILTQVLVDQEDKCFKNPSKPIGPLYDKKRAGELEKSQGYILKEDNRKRGYYRRVVASPKPIKIVEIEEIKALINQGFIVIACGGGGIPVIMDEKGVMRGISGVIDKDFSSSRLGQDIDADNLLIVTAVEKVALNFGRIDEILIDKISSFELEKYIGEGHFESGSMLPKVEASIEFVRSGGNSSREGCKRKAIITSLNNIIEGINGKGGTIII
ncbi:carbamate kinase [Borrelia sp. HM]|uniref:carbamate kinase n=1 Tax=Borrelia sp. HM TaxID=1882662 RepID=UPI001C772801|nr:carbamate kinase [Borrelia sp. HM]BCR22252.1 Carbamate kinase 1 [Borrelia sp. HM]